MEEGGQYGIQQRGNEWKVKRKDRVAEGKRRELKRTKEDRVKPKRRCSTREEKQRTICKQEENRREGGTVE